MPPPSKKAKTSDAEDEKSLAFAPNPHLRSLSVDHLYHIGLDSSMDLRSLFGGVTHVAMGGSPSRMESVAKLLPKALGVDIPLGMSISPIGKTDRFSLYKVGSVLAVSHGMGMPSMSILLHELAKLLSYAREGDVDARPPPVLIRIGTSGGIGLKPGTVVVTTTGMTGELKPSYSIPVLGKMTAFDASFDEALCRRALDAATTTSLGVQHEEPVAATLGKTVSTDCFYEGQGRLDGALCEYTSEEKLAFLKRAHDAGVRNFEMEAACFGAFVKRTGLRGLVLCCTLLDRLNGDQVDSTPEQLAGYGQNAIEVALRFIRLDLQAQQQ
mmetsp:Transcript_1793/g.5748  ORF Transcript_1793/g.5748 Transcript_1793/m.5748 type:complete len:326 (+) Transcript_1793:155-1132(+)